jgi:hypothetical protein
VDAPEFSYHLVLKFAVADGQVVLRRQPEMKKGPGRFRRVSPNYPAARAQPMTL